MLQSWERFPSKPFLCAYVGTETDKRVWRVHFPFPYLQWYVTAHSNRKKVPDLHSGLLHTLDAAIDGDLVALLSYATSTVGVGKMDVAVGLFRYCFWVERKVEDGNEERREGEKERNEEGKEGRR